MQFSCFVLYIKYIIYNVYNIYMYVANLDLKSCFTFSYVFSLMECRIGSFLYPKFVLIFIKPLPVPVWLFCCGGACFLVYTLGYRITTGFHITFTKKASFRFTLSYGDSFEIHSDIGDDHLIGNVTFAG